MKSILNRLFLILSFLCWADYSQAQNYTTTEKLDCVLFETFLKDFITIESQRFDFAAYMDTTLYTRDSPVTIIFIDCSSSVSHCNIEMVSSSTQLVYHPTDDENKTSISYYDILISLKFKYRIQSEYRMNPFEEEKLYSKFDPPVVITSVYEENGITTIKYIQMMSTRTGIYKYVRKENKFSLAEYERGQY